METQPTIVIPENAFESVDMGQQLSGITSSLTEMLAPFILMSLVITGLFLVMHIISMVRRRKIENAIFDMQKTLHEINERDKARSKPVLPASPAISHGTIAATDSIDDKPVA